MELLKNSGDLRRFVPPGLVIIYLFRWLLRERWAGPLLLDASGKRSYGYGGLVFWMALLAFNLLLNDKLKFIWWNALSVITYHFVLSSKLEFRKSGIITGSGFYSWRRIQFYQWEPSEHTNDALLKLSMRNSLRIFSVKKLPIREEKRAEAKRIVKQFVLFG